MLKEIAADYSIEMTRSNIAPDFENSGGPSLKEY